MKQDFLQINRPNYKNNILILVSDTFWQPPRYLNSRNQNFKKSVVSVDLKLLKALY